MVLQFHGLAVVVILSCNYSALVIITTQSNFLEPRISKPPDNSEAKFDSFLSIVHWILFPTSLTTRFQANFPVSLAFSLEGSKNRNFTVTRFDKIERRFYNSNSWKHELTCIVRLYTANTMWKGSVNLTSLSIKIFSWRTSEGFIVKVKALFSHLYIGFALVYPFIHDSFYTCLFGFLLLVTFIP